MRRLLSLRELARTLFIPGKGQAREHIPEGMLRKWTDFQLWSHIAFVPGIAVAATPLLTAPLPELAALQATTLGLSICYHRNYERPGTLAIGEGIFAKALFTYGATQTVFSPTPGLLALNSTCLALTAAAYVSTNADSRLYERWHPIGLHFVPGAWSLNVAMHNDSLLPPHALQSVHDAALWLHQAV